jgi:maltose phosphorylase
MKQYLKIDPWKIIEEGFHENYNRVTESIFSIGNGKFGQRGNLEEFFSGDSLQGNYVSGVYYPDKTRVGWWKNGYPEYFAKVLNAPNWLGMKAIIEGEKLDLASAKVTDFKGELNMQNGKLSKSLNAELSNGKKVAIDSFRFISMANDEIAVISYSITPLNFSGEIEFILDLDGDIRNADANYDEQFWKPIGISGDEGYICMETHKTAFQVCNAMRCQFTDQNQVVDKKTIEKDKYVAHHFRVRAEKGIPIHLVKYVGVCSSFYHNKRDLISHTLKEVGHAANSGIDALFLDHENAWAEKWKHGDIQIEGDPAAQQGIRFNIFHLHQTYTGDDPRLNIGPKGMTGEKYGGSTYWDTEAYCLPFYMSTSPKEVSRNLLRYRYNHLDKAIENAEKLGFKNGAALYPMVTMNGEECHNEWEITFEEIHRNGAIAYAIFNFIRYYDDASYLLEGGLEVLIAISRFWEQRVNYSEAKNKYVILGVTGPNEYENNVNNNWYTNRVAVWCLEYTLDCINRVKEEAPSEWERIKSKLFFSQEEIDSWMEIIGNMHYPVDQGRRIFIQQDGFFDKQIQSADEIEPDERPIHEHWSWDRILRSCYIKQADVLQGLWFLEHLYDIETIERNYRFYEPLTVHESSLSSCIHGIQANLIGDHQLAYKYYLNASRLDLDDYNNDTEDGLHITSMGGTWMTIVYGFAGMRVKENHLFLNPSLPESWSKYSFNLMFRGAMLRISIGEENIILESMNDQDIQVSVRNKSFDIQGLEKLSISYA